MNYFIGLDIGTSSVKAVGFSTALEVIATTSKAYPTIAPKPGWQEQNPEQVVRAAVSVLKKLVSTLGKPPIAVGLSAAMHSLICMDEKGDLLTNSILWSDIRASDTATALKGTSLGDTIYRQTGTPIHPMSPLPKIVWLRQYEPAIFEKTSKFLGIKEYLVFRLFGVCLTDQSMASATGLFNAELLDWNKPSLDFAGISTEQLPQHVSPCFVLNKLKPKLARQIGIPDGLPWIIGATDGCLANLGAGARSEGEAVLSIGTSGALRATTNRPVHDPKARIFNYLLLPPTTTEPPIYVTGGASNNGAVIYEWFCRQFFGLSPGAKAMGRHLQAMRQVPMGCEGLRFNPHLLGERAPLWDASATGSFQGIQSHHTLAHFHRAVLEGILLNLKAIGDVLEEVNGPFHTLYANGGFTKMPFWVEMASEIFGKKVVTSNHEGGPALGAAILCKQALS